MRNVPTSSDQIPPNTGLVQFVDCRGIAQNPNRPPKFIEPLSEPISAQITTFANGMREVSCLHASKVSIPSKTNTYCTAGNSAKCIYAFETKKKS